MTTLDWLIIGCLICGGLVGWLCSELKHEFNAWRRQKLVTTDADYDNAGI